MYQIILDKMHKNTHKELSYNCLHSIQGLLNFQILSYIVIEMSLHPVAIDFQAINMKFKMYRPKSK